MIADLRKFDCGDLLVSPSLLAADFARLDSEIARVEKGGAELLHLDVMDGHFVPNLSFGGPVITSIRKVSKLLFDVHLMISHPEKYAASFAKAGADHITFHVESDDDPEAVIRTIRETGCTAGICVKPKTPAEAVFPYLDKVDMVLVMTVEPGFGGQKFMADMMSKVQAIRQEIDRKSLKVHLEVDGGVDRETVKPCIAAGANIFVAGTSVFRAPDGAEAAIAGLKHR